MKTIAHFRIAALVLAAVSCIFGMETRAQIPDEPGGAKTLLAQGLWSPEVRGQLAAAPTTPMQTQPRQNETDSAATGGQAGGMGKGIEYAFAELRCQPQEAIVGLNIRRGDVLDFVQIACAVPNCTDRGCSWSADSFYWGLYAGNPNGGDPHPAMVCGKNEMLAGFRARVVTFTKFDYAQDIEIQCAPILFISQGFYRIAEPGDRWHHPEGSISRSHVHGQVVRAYITRPISCSPNGGAAAVSLGIATNWLNLGERVVQAVSVYCPKDPATCEAPSQPPGKIRGSLSDNAAESVSLDEFIAQFGTGNSGGLPRWTNGQYGAVRDSSGRIVKNYRYVRTPGHPEAIIDMRHFQFVGPLGQGFGTVVECLQGIQGQASAFQRQDFYSNALGEYFRDFNYQHPNTSYTDNLRAFFNNQTLINSIVGSAKTVQSP